jgi:HlyD family secretion protein
MAERLKKFINVIKKRRTPIGIVLLLAVVVAVAAFIWGGKANASDYITAKVDRGTVEVTVSATGTVQAVVTVQVGSQVSGTVSWLGADFNTNVKKGQIIARLDPAIFQAQVDNARANVGNAEAAVQAAETEINNQKANVAAAKANQEVTKVQRDDAIALVKRYKELKDVLSGRDLEAAQAQASAAAARYEQAGAQVGQSQAASASAKAKLDQAKASLAQSKAQLQQAQVNLDHSIIPSPIDGVVVSRAVDVGQTVAASLSAPTLFTIANDLTKMQVLASVDEADVGQVRTGIKANFTVDAYPGETFSGEISQVRLNAQTLQNVVTYSAVIDVANNDLKLRPGMTANITVPVARKDNVLTVPNAALRFKPTNISDEEIRQKLDQRRQQREAERQAGGGQEAQEQQPAAQGQDQRQGNENRQHGGPRAEGGQGAQGGQGQGGQGQGGQSAQGGQGQGGQGAQGGQGQGGQGGQRGQGQGGGGGQRRQFQTVWVLTANKTIEPRFVRTGLTNGRITEITGDIHEGDTVVIGQNDTSGANRTTQPTGSPFGQQRPGGGGRPPGR